MSIPQFRSDIKLLQQARDDYRIYADALVRGDTATCVRIEKKYGLYGLPPEKVSIELFEIGAPGLAAGRAN